MAKTTEKQADIPDAHLVELNDPTVSGVEAVSKALGMKLADEVAPEQIAEG
ncbi:conserved hypothetical protein [Ricinus communis]|uniref:Uncharacterized protein n=1 Tax=Ricinus communis TaxID=3988 RepID=B9TG27_RICCO|nr:conserved hypothetical protein [Ricinus communis]